MLWVLNYDQIILLFLKNFYNMIILIKISWLSCWLNVKLFKINNSINRANCSNIFLVKIGNMDCWEDLNNADIIYESKIWFNFRFPLRYDHCHPPPHHHHENS